MKRRFTLFLSFALLLLIQNSFAASGGPDAYGYIWRDSNEPNGPTPAWFPVGPGWVQVTGLADDNSVGMFPISWYFHFYWGDYNTFKVGSNGWISLQNTANIAHCFPSIPTAGGAGDLYLAPLMSDLTFSSSFPAQPNVGEVWYWTNAKDSLFVSYINTPWWQNGTPDWYGSNNFQIFLNGRDSSITFRYQNMNPSFTNNAGCATDIVIGIENQTGSIGLQCFAEVLPASNYAIKFSYPPTVLINVPDVAPNWNQNPENGGVFFPTGLIPALQSNIKNVGNVALTTNTACTGRLRTLAQTIVYTSTQNQPTLPAGFDTTVTFTPQAVVNTAGQYYWEVTATNNQDINVANNVKISEVNMVNMSGPTATLTYATGGASTGSIGWNGGGLDDGVGVYMEPPIYPVSIASIEYYVASNAGESMIAAVYDDDGVNGTAGTLLWSDTIPAGQIIAGGWNTVTLPVPLAFTSGGFYVAWFMGGPNIFIGYENNGPISRRSYEILGGSWAGYRDNVLHDFLIEVNITNYPCALTSNFTYTSNATTLQFTNGSTGATTYLWDFGDGQTSTALSPSHTYASIGTYNVCLISTNTCGNDTACQVVNVTCPAPTASFSYVGTGITAQFTDLSTGAPTSWLWDFGDGGSSTLQNPSHTYANQGTYNVCLISTSFCGTDTFCQQVVVCIQPTPNYLFNANGLNVTFTNLTSGATSYLWSFGDGSTSTFQNPTHTYAIDGYYLVCLHATNSCATDSICQTVYVCAPANAAFGVNTNQLTASFTDQTVGSPTSYLWTFGDGNTSTQPSPTHTYALPGTYLVCLTVTDTCASDSSCSSVTVNSVGLNAGLSGLQLQAWPNPTEGSIAVEVRLANAGGGTLQVLDLAGRKLQTIHVAEGLQSQRLELDLRGLAMGMYFLKLESEGYTRQLQILRQ